MYVIDLLLGNANPGAFLKPRVCGFDGLQTRVPGYPGLIMSLLRPARVDGKPAVSGHLSETDLRSVGSCTLRGGRRLMEVGLS